MRFSRILTFATVCGLMSVAGAATTELETTTVRAKPSSTAKAIAKLPAGTSIEILGQEGGFTKVKYKAASGSGEGYVASTQLNVGAKDVTKSVGKSVATRTGYGKDDVAAAINMGVSTDTSAKMMKAKPTTLDVGAAADEIDDEFEGLPEDVTSDVQEGANSQVAAVGKSAANTAAKNDEELGKKKAQFDKSAKDVKAVNNLRKAVDGSTQEEVEKQNAVLDAVSDSGMGDAIADGMSSGGGAVNSMVSGGKAKASKAAAVGDMSNVEALEAIQFSKSDFGATSPFLSEGRLKSKTLK